MARTATSIQTPPAPANGLRFLLRVVLLAAFWFCLNGTELKSWAVGAPTVLAAAWISLRLLPSTSWRVGLPAAAYFVGYFMRESLQGGWDVARRALSPDLPLSPGILCFAVRLPVGTARWFFCHTISLLPGTAVVAIERDRLRVHVLQLTPHVEGRLRDLEERVARLFCLKLQEAAKGAE
jgi:multicomponent Na+:H+ antiporter subunit E